MVRIDRGLLERQCAQHLGHELRRPIEFELGMDLSSPGGQSWCGLVHFLVSELDRDKNVFTSPLTRAHVEQLVIATLLLAQPHRYRVRPAPPVVVL